MKHIDSEYEGRCPRCGSDRWISVSLNEGYTRIPQCVQCGTYHGGVVLGPGWKHPDFYTERSPRASEPTEQETPPQ